VALLRRSQLALFFRSVPEVAIYSDRVELHTPSACTAFQFDKIARRHKNILVRWSRWLKSLVTQTWFTSAIGEREFCTGNRYVAFYTNPTLKIFTPPDSDAPYAETYIFRINAVLRRGGYGIYDLS
jgi:hypothetical protein